MLVLAKAGIKYYIFNPIHPHRMGRAWCFGFLKFFCKKFYLPIRPKLTLKNLLWSGGHFRMGRASSCKGRGLVVLGLRSESKLQLVLPLLFYNLIPPSTEPRLSRSGLLGRFPQPKDETSRATLSSQPPSWDATDLFLYSYFEVGSWTLSVGR